MDKRYDSEVEIDMLGRSVYVSVIAFFLMSSQVFGAESAKTSTVSIAIQNVFSMEFYADSNVIYRDAVPFTNVDPNQSIVYADGRSVNDGKSDTGVVCKSNMGTPWYFKLHIIPNPPLAPEKLRYYIDQPYNRNTGGRADGALTRSPQWYAFSSIPTTIYTSGFSDSSNLPFGTLITFNFSLVPTGLNAGQAYSAAVVYTMTTVP